MRLDTQLMRELEALPLMDKVMAILSDIHEITKNIIEKKSNILETFEIPFKSAFQDFFDKEGKAIVEMNPSYLDLVINEIFQQKLIEYSLGDKKTARKEAYFKEAFKTYKEMIEKKVSTFSPKENLAREKSGEEPKLSSYISDEKIIAKVKDLVEFIYIYRYNQKNNEDSTKTEEILKFLNTVYNKRHGDNFLQNNIDLYQQIEQVIESLAEIPDKTKRLETIINGLEWNTIELFSLVYWLYSRGEIAQIAAYLEETDLCENLREYIIDLILKRAETKSNNQKIKESVKKAREIVKDIISKLNDRTIPVISKAYFEKLVVGGVEYFPEYFKPTLVNRIKDNVYLYIKAEKIKNG